MNIENHLRPHVPRRLVMLHYLRGRMAFDDSLRQEYDNLQRGYSGEKKFFECMSDILPNHSFILYSFDLPHRSASFQLDSLLFFGGRIYLFEIKYFAGDYVIEDGNWFTAGRVRREINNPFVQLERACSFFRQLAGELGWKGDVVGRLVFMHERFTLYGASVDDPIIFLSQLERKMREIVRGERGHGEAELALAKNLVARHQDENRYDLPIAYDYDDLWKGLVCPDCMGRMRRESERKFCCGGCGSATHGQEVLLYNVRQYVYLFPERPLTVGDVYDWCGGVVHTETIRRFLNENCTKEVPGRNAIYKFK